jgi:hypothetical protein
VKDNLPMCPYSSHLEACRNQWGPEEMWFLGTGIALAAVGAIGVLRAYHAHVVPSLKLTSILLSAAMFIFMVLLQVKAFPVPKFPQVGWGIFVTAVMLYFSITQPTGKEAPAAAPAAPAA